jgi:cell division protein FtsQ
MKKKILGILFIMLTIVVLFLSVSFAPNTRPGYHIDDIDVEIENAYENFFIDEDDVLSLVMQNEGDSVLGDTYGRVDLKEVEERIESHSFVRDAEVYRDLKGHLVIKATQNKPIARLISDRGESAYISALGDLLPTSFKYTARVPVITGEYVDQLMELNNVEEEEYAIELKEMIEYMSQDGFWKMQIAQLDIDQRGQINMYAQIGDQRLEFGGPNDYEKKFNKLKIFFKQIMPTKGWNTYDRVNVAYKDQIICE